MKQADETLLDALVLSSASNLLVKCIEAVDLTKVSYNTNEFAIKLVSKIGNIALLQKLNL